MTSTYLDKGKGRARDADDGPATAPWLANLNDAQREAVTWSAKGGLQILAGPGSGKTRVLTCRVAHLVNHCHIKPEDLIVVTFTNKAAKEMKHRLHTLLGEAVTNKIVMGTFHSVAVKYLRKYGRVIDLPNNFVIADQSDCQSILKPIVAKHNAGLKSKGKGEGGSSQEEIKVKVAQEMISKSKAKGMTAEAYLAKVEQEDNQSPWKLAIGDIYVEYAEALRSSNTLDFDDLLLYCEKMLLKSPSAVKSIQHVLVDEFQDTNTIQYNIVKLMARATSSLTIVGDPDQSIYAWRSAEVENLDHMLQDFKDTHQVFLEENYRSTGSILQAALAVVQQDTSRIQKSLKTSHPSGAPVVLKCFSTAQDEATYIAYEIKRAIAHSGNQLTYQDFAILLRYNALSRAIEAALQTANIPNRMIGGHKFFDRAEVKDILSYLQLAENPSYTPAFIRIVNVPKRGIGDTTIKNIVAAAQEKEISCFEVVSRALKGSNIGSIKPQQKTNLKSFARIILKIRQLAATGASVSHLVDELVTGIDYSGHLERVYGLEHTTRLENINELKSFADQVAKADTSELVEPPSSNDALQNLTDIKADDDIIELLDSDADLPQDEDNPLRTFLATAMLSTDAETQDAKDDNSTHKVTISTCHAAKGLEWPVVFVPAAETGVYPAFRKSDPVEVDEERRLLYVAMTRAQALLHLTHADRRMERGQTEDKNVTEFLQPIVKSKSVAFAKEPVTFTPAVRTSIAIVTSRSVVSDVDTQAIVDAFHSSTPLPVYSEPDNAFPREKYLTGAYSKPSFGSGGAAWRINAYAGDNAQRYAAQLPNRGQNQYANAFATTQAAGFTSALTASRAGPQPAHGPLASFQSVSSAFSTSSNNAAARSASGNNLYKPFKAPSRAPQSDGSVKRVAAIETRLSQQPQAIFVRPAAPTSLNGRAYSLPGAGHDESFAFLKTLAKEEENDYAAPLPVSGWAPGTKRVGQQLPSVAYKRTKSS